MAFHYQNYLLNVSHKLQILIVLLAVILHKENIACTYYVSSPIRLLALNSPISLNEHIPDDDCSVVHGNYLK